MTKHHLILTAQAKNAQMQRRIRSDQEAFESLHRYGFPSLFDPSRKLYTWAKFDQFLRNVGEHSKEIDAAKTPITASEANKILRKDYTAHYKVRELCKELGTPNYTDLTELEMSIRAARDYHIPNLRDWNNLAPVVLDAISFKVASQPFKKPASQEQQPG